MAKTCESTESLCYNCHKPGHQQKDCTQGVSCHKCGSIEHMARNCDQEENKGFRGGRGGGAGRWDRGAAACYNCNEVGHYGRDCPQGQQRRRDFGGANNDRSYYNCGGAGQNEISQYLFRSLTCIKCEGFAYSPTMLKCCSIILCEKCSQNRNNCPRCNSIKKTDDLSIILKQILNHAPYYCKCEQKIHYSEKTRHQRTCTYPNFRCKICTGVFTYNKLAQHFQDSHINEVISEKLFN